jgi:hypothetical protein
MEQLFPIIQNGVAKKNVTPPRKPFIEANSLEVQLHHLERECIIPVFAKDNERTISHQEFIDVVSTPFFEPLISWMLKMNISF